MERLDSLITGKNLPESARNASERLRTASEWAERQVLRASKLVRSSTIPTPLSQTEISQQVQNSDGGFFEQFLAPTSDEMKVPDETTGSNDGKLFIKKLSLNADDTRMEDLYVEVLYTIKHRVGLPNGVSNEQLIQYAQRAFGITGREHDRLMNRAKQEKPPIVLLNVLLLEARDLIAKDVNGFSDPFTMMGVVPGNRRQSITSVQSTRVGTTTNGREVDKSKESENFNTLQGAQTDDQTKSKSPILTEHFGGSFRRKIGGNDGTLRNHDKDGRQIPAKLIKASSVQRKTLNPKWNEKFQFVVDDVSTDYFHMDIWDHDDEDQSVIDAVTSLNHVSGFKGLGRYFKEVAQSARTETDECSDDFLGCITIKIEDLPSVGIEDWFSLEKRSDRSEVSGQVKLKLWLSTREERNEFDDDDLLDVKQHIELIRVFALFEISQAGMPVSAYMGTLPETALTILHQHSVQGDLTVLHDLLCSWMAYSSMLNIDISYHFLHTILAELINKWAPLILNKDAEDMLGDSFTSFDSHCRTAIINHRQRFRADHRDELESLAEMLRCLKLMRESWLFEKCLPLQRSFEATISAQIELSAGEYFKKALKSATNKDPCGQLESLLLLLNSACAKFPAYNPIFTSIASVDYASIAYSQFDRMLVEYLCSELMSEDAEKLKCSLLRATKMEDDDLRSLSTLIKIHFALTDFYGFRNSNQKLRKEDGQWGIMFDKAISRWVDAVRVRAFARADLACHLDTPIQSTADIRQSSSYVDVCRMIDMIVQAWSRMKVTDSSLWFDLCFKVVQDICKICEYYVDKILAQLATEGFCGELQMFIPAALLCIFCSTINNIEQVRRSVSIHHKLRFDELVSQFESTCHHSATWKMEIESEIDECDKYMSDQIDATIERLTGRLIPTLKKHVFHLAWSPTACAVESAIKPLTDILDKELSSVHRTLLHKNFVRVMLSQLRALLPLLMECVEDNQGLEPIFYQRLFDGFSILTDFFHAGGKGIPMESFAKLDAYQELVSTLSLNQTGTNLLIDQFYRDLLAEQNEVKDCKYGILNVRAYYNTNSQTLVIDVIGAKQLIPLDSNGLSDPFVIVELVPRMNYPSQPVAKTRVVSKNLNPLFDETFEFRMKNENPIGAIVHFIVMDHDFLRCNDFAGEAFLDLCEVPGAGPSAGSALRQFNLMLIHPSKKDRLVTRVLMSRKDDKDAQDFVRSLNAVY